MNLLFIHSLLLHQRYISGYIHETKGSEGRCKLYYYINPLKYCTNIVNDKDYSRSICKYKHN